MSRGIAGHWRNDADVEKAVELVAFKLEPLEELLFGVEGRFSGHRVPAPTATRVHLIGRLAKLVLK
ncbi:hypothetical protein CWO91_19605 [Bradyrhizobium genosp. SA-3]|nr:hypothetical protein CWO91_19605 [Bradyrhizobium genosp. SA-3]